MKILEKNFYNKNTVQAAQDLLGKKLVRIIDGQLISGIITETEAYCHADDPACHAFRGKTQRNLPMFGPVGFSYVYFIYGFHFCFNIVAKDDNQIAGAVLIRGLKPIEGLDLMFINRNKSALKNLTNGPGKLTQALNITREHNNVDLTQSNELFVTEGIDIPSSEIKSSPRIGIKVATDKLWRFYL